jgi:hypothetical protein
MLNKSVSIILIKGVSARIGLFLFKIQIITFTQILPIFSGTVFWDTV